MRILVLTRYDWTGASSRFRFFQFFPFLEKENIQIRVSPLFDEKYIANLFSRSSRPRFFNPAKAYLGRMATLLFKQTCDLVWMEKEALPWIPAFFETALYKTSVPYVIDYDDAVFHRYDQHPNPIIRGLLSRRIERIMAHSSMVVAGNRYIADYTQKAGVLKVEILPTVVDVSKYPVKANFDSPSFIIGWIGSPSTSRHIKFVSEALTNFCQQENIEFKAIGALQDDLEKIPGKVIPWNNETEKEDLTRFDVGIMPLPDTPWERGKCGFKLIQYMAAGLPVIASPVGVNSKIVEHGVNGFLANNAEEWIEYLGILRDDPELRRTMGTLGREKVERDYSLDVVGPKLAFILKEAAGG